jgi:hypothetical protein
MNALKTTSLICSALLALGLGSARAADEAAPEVSRAEVLAEIVIWQESGLAVAQSGETAGDPTRPEYVAALERFQAMRASPKFAQLVQRIARERGDKQLVAGARG